VNTNPFLLPEDNIFLRASDFTAKAINAIQCVSPRLDVFKVFLEVTETPSQGQLFTICFRIKQNGSGVKRDCSSYVLRLGISVRLDGDGSCLIDAGLYPVKGREKSFHAQLEKAQSIAKKLLVMIRDAAQKEFGKEFDEPWLYVGDKCPVDPREIE